MKWLQGGWSQSQCPSCLLGAVCRQGQESSLGTWVAPPCTKVPGTLSRGRARAVLGCPRKRRTVQVSGERGLPRARCDAVLLVLFTFLSVPVLLSPSLMRSSWSPVSLGAFYSSSFYHLYSLFSFLHLQGSLQQSLVDNLILQHDQSCSFHYAILSAQMLGWSKSPVADCGQSTHASAPGCQCLCPPAE